MDIPILAYALVAFGVYCHHLLTKISKLRDENDSLLDMIEAMAQELQQLGSPNVFIQSRAETEAK